MSNKKNILFIMCDQLRWDYLSCYGHPHLHTPNIDRLAEQGVRFDRAYCQAPICGPSRASAYTGRYVSSVGTLWNFHQTGIMYWTIGDYLREHGYRAALVGKTHSRPDRDNMTRLGITANSELGQRLANAGFEPFERDDGINPARVLAVRGKEPRYNEYLRNLGYDNENPWEQNANGSRDENGRFHSGWFLRNNHMPANVAAEHSETAYMTSRAMECIEGMGDSPWCIHLSYIKPHWPYHTPAPYNDMYGPEHILPRKAHPDEKIDPNPVYDAFMKIRGSQHFARDEVRERVIPTYMGMIKQIDDEIGRLLTRLEERGQLEKTMIVFTSDHGDFLGDHWLSEKDFCLEEAVRVPLIVYDPSPEANATRGTVETRFVELIDLAATFLDLAGGKAQPHKIEGRSLLPLLHNKPVSDWRTYAISEVGFSGRGARQILDIPSDQCRGYMIRDEKWKYVLWEGFPSQLFDLENDPNEFKDLGRDPAYADVCRRWHDELFSWLRRRAISTANSQEWVDTWGPYQEVNVGVYIGYWAEEELPERSEAMDKELAKGVTAYGRSEPGTTVLNILGQKYYIKAHCDSTFAFETNSEPGQFVPVHMHPFQDEFILVQEGVLDLKLDGKWLQAREGDLVRMPRGIPHGYFNHSDEPARALFWVSPAGKLEALFRKLHNLTDTEKVVQISAEHDVTFLPPEANAPRD
ncbi:MAG: sulfatase-like hydrolase/transferase [Chloroflexota bacterium]